MKEKDIVYEDGCFWVGCVEGTYTVYRAGTTHSVADSSYRQDADGLVLAIYRAGYLASGSPTEAREARIARLAAASAAAASVGVR